MDGDCSVLVWLTSFNMVINGGAVWALLCLFADQRRIEKRYEILLKGLVPGNGG